MTCNKGVMTLESMKKVIELDYSNRHDLPQMYFTEKELRWLIYTVEEQQNTIDHLTNMNEQQHEEIEDYKMRYENTGSIFNRSYQIDRIKLLEKNNTKLRKAIKEMIEFPYTQSVLKKIADKALEQPK